jgi:hypothetical protein
VCAVSELTSGLLLPLCFLSTGVSVLQDQELCSGQQPASLNIFLLTEAQRGLEELSQKYKEMTLEMENLRRANEELSLDLENLKKNQVEREPVRGETNPVHS